MSHKLLLTMSLFGGATESIFNQLEDRLQRRQEFFELIQSYHQKRLNHYQSAVDFLLCELYPEYKVSCHKFYRREGKPLRETISLEEKASVESTLILFLDLVEVAGPSHRHLTWHNLLEITPRVYISLDKETFFV